MLALALGKDLHVLSWTSNSDLSLHTGHLHLHLHRRGTVARLYGSLSVLGTGPVSPALSMFLDLHNYL